MSNIFTEMCKGFMYENLSLMSTEMYKKFAAEGKRTEAFKLASEMWKVMKEEAKAAESLSVM